MLVHELAESVTNAWLVAMVWRINAQYPDSFQLLVNQYFGIEAF